MTFSTLRDDGVNRLVSARSRIFYVPVTVKLGRSHLWTLIADGKHRRKPCRCSSHLRTWMQRQKAWRSSVCISRAVATSSTFLLLPVRSALIIPRAN